tara:strand:+ start:88 stop:555 length:468 start_codon:yes stop_codon:yes gene_type:complete
MRDYGLLLRVILSKHFVVSESMLDDLATKTAKKKVERLKRDTQAAKDHYSDMKDRQRHRKEIEQKRKGHEQRRGKSRQSESKSSGIIYLKNAKGQVIGFRRNYGPNRTDYFGAKGELVAREVGGITYDFTNGGRVAAWDRQGMRVVGQGLGGKFS